MGTRNLTIAVVDGETKVAQYGQWDGYYEGVGAGILEVLNGVEDMSILKDAVKGCSFFTGEEIDELNKTDWKSTHPQLSRDNAGDEIIKVLSEGRSLALYNDEGFAKDSLSCEYCYVIDFDKNTFEIFKGFNHEPLAEGERFFKVDEKYEASTSDYYAVKHVETYSLHDLPTHTEFLLDLVEDEEAA